MNYIDIGIIVIVAVFGFLGWRKGLIKTVVEFLGLAAVIVIAYVLKNKLGMILMEYLPFFNFGGTLQGVTAINILIYELVAFVVIFVILYCIINILISLSGVVEKIVEMTLILALPSKIMGMLIGIIEGTITAFMLTFILFNLPATTSIVNQSKVGIVLLERTPIISSLAAPTTLALEDINNLIESAKNDENREDVNFKVLHSLIYYQVIDSESAQKLIDNNKIRFTNTVIV